MSYLALFLTQDLIVLGTKKFKPTESFVTFKKGTFNIRLDAYLYKIKDTTIYGYIYPTDEKLLIDIDIEPIKKGEKDFKIVKGRVLTIKEKVEHGDLHLLVAESIVGQLARAFLTTIKTNWLFVVLAIGAGVAIGYIACSVTTQHAITSIINSTISNGTLTSKIPSVG